MAKALTTICRGRSWNPFPNPLKVLQFLYPCIAIYGGNVDIVSLGQIGYVNHVEESTNVCDHVLARHAHLASLDKVKLSL